MRGGAARRVGIERGQVPLSDPLSEVLRKPTYLAELLSTDLSRRWDKTLVLAGSLYSQVKELLAVRAEE